MGVFGSNPETFLSVKFFVCFFFIYMFDLQIVSSADNISNLLEQL